VNSVKRKKVECPICGAETLEDRKGDYRFPLPQNFAPHKAIVVSKAEWQACGSCGEVILSPDLEKKLEAERYRLLGLLAPSEIKQVRERIGVSQLEMAKLLGVGEKTYTRWESATSLQNKSMDNLIRLVDRHPELFPQLEAERSGTGVGIVADYLKQVYGMKEGHPEALAAHGELPPNVDIGDLRKRLTALLRKQRKAK
jgi:HTH-type transcriptional regulator / antitoxin MqsA